MPFVNIHSLIGWGKNLKVLLSPQEARLLVIFTKIMIKIMGILSYNTAYMTIHPFSLFSI